MKKALLLVDLQNDFMPTGVLPVADADTVVPIINEIQKKFDLIIATQDWHPENHKSFALNHSAKKPFDIIDLYGLEQVLWPPHCVQHTKGAEFVSTLDATRINKIIQKGTDCEIDSYSSFFDNGHRKKTELNDYLKQQNVTDVYICGLAIDYCVKFTALDAIQLGFKTYVIEDACRGVNLESNHVAQAVDEMKRAGVKVIKSQLIKRSNLTKNSQL